MIGFLKRMSRAFDQALELNRIAETHTDPEEMREALLAVIHGDRRGRCQPWQQRAPRRMEHAA